MITVMVDVCRRSSIISCFRALDWDSADLGCPSGSSGWFLTFAFSFLFLCFPIGKMWVIRFTSFIKVLWRGKHWKSNMEDGAACSI